MPTPRKGEKRKDFMARCIPIVMREKDGTTKEQAAGKCGGMYDHYKQTRNEQMELQTITLNLDTKGYREAKLNGKDYIVVPTVMMVEGVHNGSQGKLLYEGAELNKWCPAWNHKPITIDHPKKNGQYSSAADPDVLNNEQVGLVLNTTWDGKQRCESWLEKDKLKAKNSKVLNAIFQKKVLEISTGLFVDNEGGPGEWNGEKYDSIARNHRPDHLAILPNSIGACPVSKGAGLFQLNEATLSVALNHENSLKKGLLQVLMERGKLKDFAGNELSHSAIYSGLSSEMRNEQGEEWHGWIEDVFDSFFVYWDDGDLKQRKYVADDTGIELLEDAVAVQRVVSYVPLANNEGGQEGENDMAKKELVDSLIANKATKYEESDREWLTKLTDDQVKKMEPVANTEPKPAPSSPPPKEGEGGDKGGTNQPPASPKEGEGNKPPANNQKSDKEMVDEYIAKAPGPLRHVLANSYHLWKQETEKNIQAILANESNHLPREVLETLDPNVLYQMAEMARSNKAPKQEPVSNIQPNYLGLGVQTRNSQETQHEEEPLPIPTLNFGKKAG